MQRIRSLGWLFLFRFLLLLIVLKWMNPTILILCLFLWQACHILFFLVLIRLVFLISVIVENIWNNLIQFRLYLVSLPLYPFFENECFICFIGVIVVLICLILAVRLPLVWFCFLDVFPLLFLSGASILWPAIWVIFVFHRHPLNIIVDIYRVIFPLL